VTQAQTRARDTARLVALIQSLACLQLEGEPSSVMPSPEVLGENRFLAARAGMDARLIELEAQRLVAAREILDSPRPVAASLRPASAALMRVVSADHSEIRPFRPKAPSSSAATPV
jgi:gamma-glutamyl:cysteine ligase YbdK (ATP-grasp superfamily)